MNFIQHNIAIDTFNILKCCNSMYDSFFCLPEVS